MSSAHEQLRQEAEAWLGTVALQAALAQVGRLFIPPKAVTEFNTKINELAGLARMNVDVTDTQLSKALSEAVSKMTELEVERIYNLCGEDPEAVNAEEDDLDFFASSFEKWDSQFAEDGLTTEENE